LESSARRVFDLWIAGCFVAALMAPTVDFFVRPAAARDVRRENRVAAPLPKAPGSLAELDTFSRRFEAWFQDHFGLRDRLLRAHQSFLLFVAGAPPAPTMVVGREGWLFFGAEDGVPVWRGLLPRSPAQLAAFQRSVEARRDWLRARGIEYVFAIAPNKEVIYPEFMPEQFTRIGPTRLDQVEGWMREHSDVRFVDLRAALVAEKAHDSAGDYVYFPLGSHWTARGSFAGCNALLEVLHAIVPSARALPRELFERTNSAGLRGDSLGDQTYIGDLLPQHVWGFEPRGGPRAHGTFAGVSGGPPQRSTLDDPSLPRVLLVHDSFGPWIWPHLAEACSQLTAVWDYALPKDLILIDPPQVVVELFTERALRTEIPPMQADYAETSAAGFAKLAPLLGPLDVSALAERCSPKDALLGSPRGAELDLDLRDGRGTLELASEVTRDADEIAMHIDITVPSATSVNLFFQLEGARTYSRARCLDLPLPAGRNDVFVVLKEKGIRGALLLRPGRVLGRYTLHALEFRSAR
jgi:hypothetical protein